ncbi:MAG: helix-turn-helix transcriptional regulator [Synergistaceae bacterium]|nr:helix-turn-helix transcriptional regulator [Synergistaceae bacterium]
MENTKIFERVKLVRKTLKMNQKDFGKMIGLTQTSLSMIEVGTNIVTEKNIKLICATFNVREEWLREGKGKIFNNSPYVKELCDILGDLTPDTQKSLLIIAKELLKVEEKQREYEDNSLPDKNSEENNSTANVSSETEKSAELQKICEEIQKSDFKF